MRLYTKHDIYTHFIILVFEFEPNFTDQYLFNNIINQIP